MPIAIDATTLHPSTRLALAALEWLEERIAPETLLEIGCGNGILSLVADHLWQPRILACDISENAVRDAKENIDTFAPGADIEVLRSDGLKHPRIGQAGPYDLIIGNLLAQWQVQMAGAIEKHLTPGGWLLLSGIMLWQEEGVAEAFKSINIDIIQKFNENEWHCYVLCHKPAKPLS